MPADVEKQRFRLQRRRTTSTWYELFWIMEQMSTPQLTPIMEELHFKPRRKQVMMNLYSSC